MFKKLRKILGGKSNQQTGAVSGQPEQAVLVHFEYGNEELADVHAVEEQLTEVLQGTGAGVHDGHDIAIDASHGTLYLYGTDADKLFMAIRPTLLATESLKNISLTLRYGAADDPNAREVKLALNAF